MAVKRSQNFLNQQRVDVPHMRSIESAVRNDFDDLFATLIMGDNNSYVVRGFDIEIAGSIGASANGLQLIVEDSAILHGKSEVAGTFYNIPAGEPNQTLSSTTNVNVEGAFTPSALNYIGLELTREVDDSTTAQVYLWNPATQVENTKTLPLAQTLGYKIVISSSNFASNVLPISIVETDVSNNVISIQDRRPMLFRLGTAGANTPNPFYEYPWDNHAEGRTENFWQSSSSTSSPFRGGDKQIRTFKENDEAIKTELKLIKGTNYWYTAATAGSLTGLRYDLGNTIFTGRGYIEHNNGNPGQINWNEDMFLTVVSTRLKYQIESNLSSTDIDLDDNQVAYIQLVRGLDVIPQLVFTNGADEVTSVGAISWTDDLEAGDYVKVASEEDTAYYRILSVDSASQVTLTENYLGASTGVNGVDAKIAYGVYRTSATPSADRQIKVDSIENVPFDADTYWLMLRSDSGGQPRIYLRFLNSELEQGEQIQISDQVPAALLAYIGSSNDADSDPEYSTLATDTKIGTENYNTLDGENLTLRASKLTSMMADKAQDKNIVYSPNFDYIDNTTNASAQELTFFSDSVAQLTIAMLSSANNGTIGLGGTLSLEENQAAYFTIDRNAAFSLVDLSGLTISSIADVPLAENVFVFAVRSLGNSVYLWDGTELSEGRNLSNGAISEILNDNAYEETLSVVSGAAANTNEVNGPIAANTNLTIPNDSRDGNVSQGYVVGQGVLEVYLNNQLLTQGLDWQEVGASGFVSTEFEILIDLEVDDVLVIRIDTAGGYFGVGTPGGGEANTASNVGTGSQVFKQKNSVNFEFRTLTAGTNVSLAQNADEIVINSTGGGSSLKAIKTVSSNTTIVGVDDVILVDATLNNVILTLPDATALQGKVIIVKKIDSSANSLTLQGQSSQTIDDDLSISFTTQYESRTVISNGTNWFII